MVKFRCHFIDNMLIGLKQFHVDNMEWTRFKHIQDKKIMGKYFVIFWLNQRSIGLVWYTHSLPIRNGVKSWWVRFLYLPNFWMVFVSYFPNFLWSPFLIFSYIFSKSISSSLWQKILIFLLITALLLSDLNAFFLIISLLASSWIF